MSDVIIIGAGLAGCVAAIMLARGGWHVRLIEQHRFPRDKVCGECLSALGCEVIERLGLGEGFRRLSPIRLSRCLIHAPNGSTVDIALPQPMWGISRLRLDEWLLSAARDAGAIVIQPARCERLIPGPRPRVIVRDLVDNQIHDLDVSCVFLADGKCGLVASRPAPTADLGLKSHFVLNDAPADAIELFGIAGHYGGVAPIEDGRFNVAFSVPRRRVNHFAGNLDALFEQITRGNISLQNRFAFANRVRPWLTSPLPRFAIAPDWPENIIPLGNAAAALEPIGGEGMGLAMRSAEIAAEMLLIGRFDIGHLRYQFRALWRARRLSCRAAAMAISQPWVANLIAPITGHVSSLESIMMKLMGKNIKTSVEFNHRPLHPSGLA